MRYILNTLLGRYVVASQPVIRGDGPDDLDL